MNINLMAAWVSLHMMTGNFLYEAVAGRDWGSAFERSYFQVIAISVFVFLYNRYGDARS
jgi:hypothetical protein